MVIVVVDRMVGQAADWGRRAAAALGCTAYEVAAMVSVEGGGPAVASVHANAADAEALAARLRGAGFEVQVLETSLLEREAEACSVRGFSMHGATLDVASRGGERETIEPSRVRLLLRATRQQSKEIKRKVEERAFSMGRALLSGGLVVSKTKTVQRTQTSTESEDLLFLYTDAGAPWVFAEQDVLFEGLGSAMQPSRTANFTTLIAHLRRWAPSARFDERLRRRAAQSQILGRVLSPDDHFSLAVALVARSVLFRA